MDKKIEEKENKKKIQRNHYDYGYNYYDHNHNHIIYTCLIDGRHIRREDVICSMSCVCTGHFEPCLYRCSKVSMIKASQHIEVAVSGADKRRRPEGGPYIVGT